MTQLTHTPGLRAKTLRLVPVLFLLAAAVAISLSLPYVGDMRTALAVSLGRIPAGITGGIAIFLFAVYALCADSLAKRNHNALWPLLGFIVVIAVVLSATA